MEWFELFVLILAAHRLMFMWLTQDIFRAVRTWIGKLGPRVHFAIHCPVCVSFWAGAAVLGLWYAGWYGQAVDWVLAISLGGALLETVISRLQTPTTKGI